LDEADNKEVFLKKNQFVVLKVLKNILIKTENSEHLHILQDGQTFEVFGPGGMKEKTFYSKSL